MKNFILILFLLASVGEAFGKVTLINDYRRKHCPKKERPVEQPQPQQPQSPNTQGR